MMTDNIARMPTPTTNGKPDAKPALEPELVSAGDAARLCGVAISSWWRLHAAGKSPAPVRLGGRTLWKLGELRLWVAGGCPDRKSWEATKAVRGQR